MKRSIVSLAVITLVIAALYGGTLHYPFVFDDDHVVETNDAIKDPANIPGFFYHIGMFSGQKRGWGSYRPLTYASIAVNYIMTGMDPLSYHLTGILLHILCSFMVYLLARSLIGFNPPAPGEPYAGDDTRAWPYALGAALIFALHPVQTEPAIYTTARSATLVSLNCLVSLWLFVEYRKRGGRARLLGSAVMYGLALFSKEMAVPFLLVFPLVDRYVCVKGGCRQRWTSYAPHLMLAASFVALRAEIMVLYGSDDAFTRGFVAQWMSATAALAEYWKLLFLPLNQSIDHDAITVTGAANMNLFIGVLIISATVLVFAAYWRQRPLVSALIAWPLLVMSPEILMPINDLIVEYRLYLPMAGMSILAAYVVKITLSRMDARQAGAALAACAAVLVAFAALTHHRTGVWETRISIWADAVSKHPYNARARSNLGFAYGTAGEPKAALAELEEAVRLDPDYPDALNNLGTAYADLGMLDKAINCYRRAIAAEPRHFKAWRNLAISLIDSGRPEEAYKTYEDMMKAIPEDPIIPTMAAVILAKKGYPELADRFYAEHGGPPGARQAAPPEIERKHRNTRRYKKTFRR